MTGRIDVLSLFLDIHNEQKQIKAAQRFFNTEVHLALYIPVLPKHWKKGGLNVVRSAFMKKYMKSHLERGFPPQNIHGLGYCIPQRYVLNFGTWKCEFNWKRSLCRYNQGKDLKMRSFWIRVSSNSVAGVLI